MRLLLSGCLFSISITVSGQGGTNTFKLPEILHPSPDVAALSKGSELSSTPHTGGANASIPVYEMVVDGFKLPISINYSSNGFKPEEIPSRIGIGWSLNAGGSVSRIQRGKPDDYCTPISNYLTESQITAYNSAAYYFITDLEDQASYHDAQPDEYQYNVNGLSGKFIIQRDGSVLQLPYNNVKITVSKNQGAVTDIYVTDGNGIKYSFGQGMTEQTLEHNLVNNFINKQSITTAWMLTRISLPTGDYIDFGYGSISHYVQSGTMESVRKGIVGDYCAGPGGNISCPVDAVYSSKTSLIRYSSKYLSTIIANTGQSVNIAYVDRPDAGGDNRVDYITASNGFGTAVKKVQLEYVDRHNPNNTPFNEGFFLKKVHVKDPTNATNEEQVFELSYVDEANAGAGATFTYGLDHLGFANGANNSTLLPVVNTYVYNGYPLFQNIGTANREPNGNYSKKGMLEKITYPTGGYDQFSYEPNMKTWWDSVDVQNIITARTSGVGASSPYNNYSILFTPGRNCPAEFYLKVTWDGTGSEPAGDPAPKTAFAHLYNNATNELIAMRWVEGHENGLGYHVYGDLNLPHPLTGGVEYRLELEVRYGSNVFAQADIVYDAGHTKEWKQLSEELCGVRVRKIISYDPVSRKQVNKFYSYRSLTDTLNPAANKLYNPQYVTPYDNGIYCTYEEVVCHGYVLSSNSATTLYSNQAAGVTYKWVIESDDSSFANGGVEHTYITQGMFNGLPLIGGNIPDMAADPYNYMNGVDSQAVYFNKDRATVRKTNNYYSIDSRINQAQYSNYMVRKRYDKVLVGSPWDEHDFEHLDLTTYPIYTRWDHLDSTVTSEYDLVNNKVLKAKTSYTYENTNNIQPTIAKTFASDNSEMRKEMKYPTDLTSQPVCSTMVAKNIVEPVMEEKNYKDSKLLYQTNTDYKDWFNNASILAPEIIKNQKNTNSQENRIHYYQYDTKGNPLELSKENDTRITYIWDYNSTLPIAEVTNASWGSGVAYTSFEADGKGGWTFSGTPVTEGTEPAGKKSYSLSSGNITYSGTMTSGKKYYVTYWAKGGTVSVNGSAGTSMLVKNNWTLYRKTITYSGSGGVTVSGSGYIDELRLYPDAAFMKTFTYTPEVGITTAADNNSTYQQYEYDVFNRLLRIRDMDRNILKQYEYKYGIDITPCTNTTADWQATGHYRCQKNNPVNNNNTGIQEREEIDQNNCSETYLQSRWVPIGTSSQCPVTSSCTGPDKRVINGVCVTGCKKIVSSVYLGNLQWSCTFHYYWSQDGFTGPDFTETSNYYCQQPVCGQN